MAIGKVKSFSMTVVIIKLDVAFTTVTVQYTCVSLTQYTRHMVPYEYKYLCIHKYQLAPLDSIRSTGTYAPKFTVWH